MNRWDIICHIYWVNLLRISNMNFIAIANWHVVDSDITKQIITATFLCSWLLFFWKK